MNTVNSLTQERASTSNAIQIPQITLPKGGGAVKGIDEKFKVNPSNGTASFNIPLPLSPNRNDFTPSLSISYNSGAGNSILGIGWGLDIPSIKRKTDKILPRYHNFTEEEDTFMFSGVEDLVPVLEWDCGEWKKEFKEIDGYKIEAFRPRIEGAFSRIERISHCDLGVYWKVTSRENVTTVFGRNSTCRIANPENEQQVYEWLPEFSFDDKGSIILYQYKREDLANVVKAVHEKNRLSGLAQFSNLYLKRVRYGNTKAYYPFEQEETNPYDPPIPEGISWHFELVLDYGEHDLEKPKPNEEHNWPSRPDAFSSYRSSFEIRTYRLLRRALMFHHFPELNGEMPTLVRSLDLKYINSDSENTDRETELEFLQSITQVGYVWMADENRYSKKALPPMEFEYQSLQWNHQIKTIEKQDLVHSPVGLSANYQWVDLFNEGISGILTEQATGWFYKRNLGDIDEDGRVQFENAQQVLDRPSLSGISNGVLQVQDLEASGEKQIVVNAEGLQGYFELHEHDEKWEPFRSFLKTANVDLQDPNVRVFDINGDGKAEIVLSDQGAFWWWEGAGKAGYDTPELARKPYNEEHGPAVVFSDKEQRIFLADMCGDGLTDIVRICNGEVCYWPNMGYGRFGRKVTMSNAPWFDNPDLFNPDYLQLADISGTGASDLIYLGKSKFKAYLNLSGNRWGSAEIIEPFFPTEQPNRLTVTDLLGNGTSCLVWSSEMPAYGQAPMRYIDLMSGIKPHIMTKYANNFGKEVMMEYKSSTWFYQKDRKEGKPWITKLPFPVQCVRKTVIEEKISNLRFTSQYTYHHGHYDHVEREFRGFGRVEQLDTETFGELSQSNAANGRVETLHQPPILTKTWFHTGLFVDNLERVLTQFEEEYWYNNPDLAEAGIQPIEVALPDAPITEAENVPADAQLLENFCPEEWREALRSCKGMPLRQEIFSPEPDPDCIENPLVPYSVATHNCDIQALQPRHGNQYAVFVVKESEAINYHYERRHDDPRIAHTLNVEVDEYGNILESASVVYGRLQMADEPELNIPENADPKLAECIEKTIAAQQQVHVIYTKNDFTKDNQQRETVHRLPVLWQTCTYEINGLTPPQPETPCDSPLQLFVISDFKDILQNPAVGERPYHVIEPPSECQSKRLIEKVRTLFLNDDDLTSPLQMGEQGQRGLTYENYQLAYTPELRDYIFQSDPDIDNTASIQVSDADMEGGRFVQLEGNWWIRSGITHFIHEGEMPPTATARFFTPIAYTDPFDSVTKVVLDPHVLFVQKVEDALGNTNQVEHFNYRSLSPQKMRDLNDDLSEVLLDELGLVKATAVMGKGDEADNLGGLTEWETPQDQAFKAAFWEEIFQEETNSNSLQQHSRDLLNHATTRFVYDFDRYRQSGADPDFPVAVAGISREEHHAVLEERGQTENHRVQLSIEYTDGLGQVAMKKAQAEPGESKKLETLPDGSHYVVIVDTGDKMRWVGNGRTVYNNKGNPILQYEPYFSASAGYESAPELVEHGVFIQLTYDAVGRVIRTDFPDRTFSKVEFDAWQQTTFDQNDTATETEWYAKRLAATGDDHIAKGLRRSAKNVELHAGTPSRMFLDSLGRPVLAVEHLKDQHGADERHYTRVELDIEGNARAVFDARFNRVMSYGYDLLGHRVFQDSMDAGRRWMFNNSVGNPVKLWDQRKHLFTYTYDALQRPLENRVQGGDGDTPLDVVFEKAVYGENQADDKTLRLRGKVLHQYDTVGRLTNAAYDFKGNPIKTARRLAKDFQGTPDWSTAEPEELLQEEAFVSLTIFDALNRPVQQVAPRSEAEPERKYNIVQTRYNDAGLMEKTHAWLQQEELPASLLDPDTATIQPLRNIDYNEKAQRTRIQYGNDVTTKYKYDPETFRLKHLRTTHNGQALLQDLHYTYDPNGNITLIWDKAIPTTFFGNHKVEPVGKYKYDSLYRLTQASGREHIGQVDNGKYDNWDDAWSQTQLSPNDAIAMRKYKQTYRYDAVGNILQMRHSAGPQGSWTREYQYEEKTNRLINTTVGSKTYEYPHHALHGFITSMPHLPTMQWNFKEELAYTVKTAGQEQDGTWYIYNSSGQRTRKINATATGEIQNERIYLGGLEVYRNADGLERETLHLMDGEQRILMVDMRTAGTDEYEEMTQRYQLGNHLGSVALEMDEKGEVINYEEYHPYGTTALQVVNKEIKATAKRYRYTGMERDEETGLEYHSARYYLSWLGRWLSSDPSGLRDGPNLFKYSNCDPVGKLDITGNEWCWNIFASDCSLDTEGIKRTAKRAAGGAYGASANFAGFIRLGAYDSWAQSFSSSSRKRVVQAQAGVDELIGAVDEGRFLEYVGEGIENRGNAIEAAERKGDHFGAGATFGDTAMTGYFVGRGTVGIARGGVSAVRSVRTHGFTNTAKSAGYGLRYWATQYEGLGLSRTPSVAVNPARGSISDNYATYRATRIIARETALAERALAKGGYSDLRAVQSWRNSAPNWERARYGTAVNRVVDERIGGTTNTAGVQLQEPLGTNTRGNPIYPDYQLNVNGSNTVIDITTPGQAGKALKYPATTVMEPLTGTAGQSISTPLSFPMSFSSGVSSENDLTPAEIDAQQCLPAHLRYSY